VYPCRNAWTVPIHGLAAAPQFYSYGEIQSIRKIDTRHCAFVTYSTRGAAERAIEELSNRLIIHGQRLKLMWGRPQEKRPEAAPADASAAAAPSTSGGPPLHMLPPQVRRGIERFRTALCGIEHMASVQSPRMPPHDDLAHGRHGFCLSEPQDSGGLCLGCGATN
jgi:RNA recognition motif. (a.k.a. RRM, RBD, or RNP domain)